MLLISVAVVVVIRGVRVEYCLNRVNHVLLEILCLIALQAIARERIRRVDIVVMYLLLIELLLLLLLLLLFMNVMIIPSNSWLSDSQEAVSI